MQWLLRIVAMFSVAMRDATFVEQIEEETKTNSKNKPPTKSAWPGNIICFAQNIASY